MAKRPLRKKSLSPACLMLLGALVDRALDDGCAVVIGNEWGRWPPGMPVRRLTERRLIDGWLGAAGLASWVSLSIDRKASYRKGWENVASFVVGNIEGLDVVQYRPDDARSEALAEMALAVSGAKVRLQANNRGAG